MTAMHGNGTAHILVCADQMDVLQELRRVLAQSGRAVDAYVAGAPEPDNLARFQLLVVDAGRDPAEALSRCQRFRGRVEDGFTPILYVTDDHSPAARLACFEAGADAYLLRPFAPEELLAQARALLRIKDVHDRLNEKTTEIHRINKRLQQAYKQIDQELELAHRIQTSFLPQTLPEAPGSRFAVHYKLCGQVGGDFYDVFRLDENHVGFYVADAMGHGVPASLLTIFVKKGVRPKEVFGKQYRLVPPGEVLGRLNKELIDQQLSDTPFITMAYGLFNHRDGVLRFARAGHPYPLLIPREGDLDWWRQEGLLLGVVDATFPTHTYRLRPGDKVLLYSDGVDTAVFEGGPPGAESLRTCAERHRDLAVQEFLPRLTRDLFGGEAQPDDLTLLALEMCELEAEVEPLPIGAAMAKSS
jgi:sigma-B regulation protein RsbU (phosphoserine phosphatase)